MMPILPHIALESMKGLRMNFAVCAGRPRRRKGSDAESEGMEIECDASATRNCVKADTKWPMGTSI
jgi:hypothetical protein